MNIKIDASFFSLKYKPSIWRPLNIIQIEQKQQKPIDAQLWQFKYFEQFTQIDKTFNGLVKNVEEIVKKRTLNKINQAQQRIQSASEVDQILEKVKKFLQKCQYYKITLRSNDLLNSQYSIKNLYQYPQSFRTCILLSDIEKLFKRVQDKKDSSVTENKFLFIEILEKVAIRQIPRILKFLKENLYIPSIDLLQNILEKLDFRFDENLSLVQNMSLNKLDLNNIQDIQIFYQIFIYQKCSTLKGLCEYLGFSKNILLDHKSGALASDHQTWVQVYETCLKLYARNPQVRQKKWLEIDQILSTTVIDQQFTVFLLNENVENFSLSTLNFYMKNLNKTQQESLQQIAEMKIMSLLDKGLIWKSAQDIVQHLGIECSAEIKQRVFNKVISQVDSIFMNDSFQNISYEDITEMQMGLTYFIESICKNLNIAEKIFNKNNMRLIADILKKQSLNEKKMRLIHRIFTQFVINSFDESDDLASYLEQHQDIITQILPEIITSFKFKNYSLPKELYKLIFHSVSDIQLLSPNIWRGIAQLYITQSFDETIDLEMFHSQIEQKKKISDEIVVILKQLTINNSKQNLIISETLRKNQNGKQSFKKFLLFKSFKDELVFNNILMMSTYFGQFLPFTQLSSILKEFYTPLVNDIKWKSAQSENLTILSFLCEELPIDVLKVTYKFLKQGYSIDIESFKSLSSNFWSLYFSDDSDKKVAAIVNQRQISFESYDNLHSFKSLDLALNMINCVFDKLNEHSQKSIKQIKVMYQWGIQYIEELLPHIYGILIEALAKTFVSYSETYTIQNVDNFTIYDRSKNISVLDFHLYGKYHVIQTFQDFNKLGLVIQHEKALQIASLLHPCFTKNKSRQSQHLNEVKILEIVFKVFALIQNSCLQQVMSDNYLAKVSKNHLLNENYNEKSVEILNEFKEIIYTQSESQSLIVQKFLEKPLNKRVISHLKLLMGKIYIPQITKLAFLSCQNEERQVCIKNIQIKFSIIKTNVQIIYKFDPLFQEHFAELMQVIEENCETSEKKLMVEPYRKEIKSQIFLKTLEMFIQCVLSNIKVRSYHIYKLIKLYLSETKKQIQSINRVIQYYIELFLSQFIPKQKYLCFNEEVRNKSRIQNKKHSNLNEPPKLRISTPQKNKNQSFSIDKVSTLQKNDKISLEGLKMNKSLNLQETQKHMKDNELLSCHKNKKDQKEQQLPVQFRKLIVQEHKLNTVQSSCTLSMFINLFARLNFSSLPGGVEAMLSRDNDKIVYLDYLMEFTEKLKEKKCSDSISSRDMQILNIDVYGNLSCILKGRVNQEILKKFIQLAKSNLSLSLPEQSVVTLPIKLLNERLFHKSARKILSNQSSFQDLTKVSKLISEFEEQPLAFQLSIKSHLLKMCPSIKSNLHVCNLEYIIGLGKSSVSKKVLETNNKLIESVLGRISAKEFLKKYDKPNVRKEILQVILASPAIQELDKILSKFTTIYQNLPSIEQNNITLLNFYFKKICSLIFFAPQLVPYILTATFNVRNQEMTFLEIIFDSLKYSLVLFCEFYTVCLKINCGFCSTTQLKQIMHQNSHLFFMTIKEKMERLTEKIPFNLVFEIYIKQKLLKLTRQGGQQNLNALRVLNFTIKQSQKFRFRFYKFIKINVPEHEDLIKKVDEQILEFLLTQLKQRSSQFERFDCGSLIKKIEVMDLCLEHILSYTMVDYAKMKLDDKLKETFYHSQYSIKCLQSVTNGLNTLKVLEEDQDEKSFEENDGLDIEEVQSSTMIQSLLVEEQNQQISPDQSTTYNSFQNLEIIKMLKSGNKPLQFSKSKVQSDAMPFIELSSEFQLFSAKETTQLKDWLNFSVKKSDKPTITSLLLKLMQRDYEKLTEKQNLSFSFQDAVYLDPQHSDQLQITAFAISENSNMSSDCCIQQTSLAEIPNEGVIVESMNSINENLRQNERNDGIFEDEVNCDGIVQEEEEEQSQGSYYDVKISIVEQTHVNKFKNYENKNGDSIVEMQQEHHQIQQEQDYPVSGTEGSIEFTSIKTLGMNEEIHLSQVSEQHIHEPEFQQFPMQISINNTQMRQFHYTIDNLTVESSQHRIQNSSLIDSLQTQLLNPNQIVSKQSINNLIQQYTLNPEILKVIKLKLKKISNVELKKVQPIAYGELKEEVEKEMRNRGIYVALSPRSYDQTTQNSLFSINKFISETFQVDQSKFYAANFKRCDKKTSQKQKIQKIPILTFNQWTHFVFIYLVKAKQSEKNSKFDINTLLQAKSLNELLIKMLCNKENLIGFLQVLLNLLSFQKVEEIASFFERYSGFNNMGKQYEEVFKDLGNVILNDLIAKLITNRIGLPILFKGKWNYDTRKLIRYEFSCLVSDSNISTNRSQGDPLLEVFLRKAIQLIYNQQLSPISDQKNNQSQHNFVKSLSEYFKSVQHFQTSEYPYYAIQDTIKLNDSLNKNRQSLLTINYNFRQPYFLNDRLRISLSETLLNTMRASKPQTLSQYEDVFHLMNYLDFETFSQFLELIVQKYKPLCQKLLDKELSLIKRFKKSSFSESLNSQKLAEMYWHMRKSSKNYLSTDNDEKDLQFFARLISSFSSSIFQKFKESIFKYGYGKEENRRKQKIAYLKKMLMNPTLENKYKSIREDIAEHQRQYLIWKLSKSTQLLKEDILPIIEKISASFNQSLKKWQTLFLELSQVFGTQRQERFILFKQCSEFYKIFLSFEMLLQQQESTMIRTMSSLKTKPSLESTRQMGVTGRRRSSLKLPRGSLVSSLCLATPSVPTFKSVFRSISPKFGFFSDMIDQSCPELRIHAKYSTLESKLKLLHQKNKGGQITIQVKRDNIWQDTIPYLNEDIAEKNVKIKITNEIGLDYGGIRRQWITLIVKELVNPYLGLFELSVNGLAFQPSALSFLVPNHLHHFYKLGILVGKALKQNWLLEINFTKSFLKHILGYTLYVEDLQDIDPSTAKSLVWILNNDVGDGDLGIDFTYQYDILGEKRCVQLIENGKEIQVNEDNKKEYVKKLANYKMTEQIREQSKAFMNGLEKIVPYDTLKLFSYKQLGIYLAGMPTVDVQEMKKYTRYQGFTVQDQTVGWFWETLQKYSEQQKANFLFFLTGSYKVPYGGFKENPISINKMPASKDYLPVAHTCFSVIDLPEYSSKEKLGFLLDKAITQGKGFSVS